MHSISIREMIPSGVCYYTMVSYILIGDCTNLSKDNFTILPNDSVLRHYRKTNQHKRYD